MVAESKEPTRASGLDLTDLQDSPIKRSNNEDKLAMPTLMRIMEDVFISSVGWLKRSTNRVIKMGITHIVLAEELVDKQISDKFEVYVIPTYIEDLNDRILANPYSAMPGVMDFLRRAALF